MRYVHRWSVPIKVIVNGAVEDWYYAPGYNPRLLPVVQSSTTFTEEEDTNV